MKNLRSLEELKRNFSLSLATISSCAPDPCVNGLKRIEQHEDNSQTRIIKKSKVFYFIAANRGSGLEKKTKKTPTIRAFCKRKQQVDLLAFRPAKKTVPSRTISCSMARVWFVRTLGESLN